MKLSELIKDVEYDVLYGTLDKEIESIAYHSEKIEKKAVFFAIDGHKEHGTSYISEGIRNGIEAVVLGGEAYYIDRDQCAKHNVTVIHVSDVRKALAKSASRMYDEPSKKMLVIGVTGTKGKTTVTYMIRQILEAAGIKTGLIGTIYSGFEGNFTFSKMTTPQSLDIQRLMNQMYENGCKAVVMEVSSQGVMHKRVECVDFDIGVFTNISPDHIGEGEHKSFDEYLSWKSRFFDMCSMAVINADDERWRQVVTNERLEKRIFYGLSDNAQFRAGDIRLWSEKDILGAQYRLEAKNPCGDDSSQEIILNIPGKFNVYNSLAAIATCKGLGIPWEYIKEAIKTVKIPGRAELIGGFDFPVIVDYAHNGIALENLLLSLKKYNPDRIILVFGCGGNRDKNRRYDMGRVASSLADLVIVTSDNPRTEPPEQIISDIMSAMDYDIIRVIEIADRKSAIQRALEEGRKGDIVVIAGKGHENYQIIAGETLHFDDREVVMDFASDNLLQTRGKENL